MPLSVTFDPLAGVHLGAAELDLHIGQRNLADEDAAKGRRGDPATVSGFLGAVVRLESGAGLTRATVGPVNDLIGDLEGTGYVFYSV